MKLITFSLLLIASSLRGEELRLGYYAAFPEDGRPSAGEILKIEDKADRTISHGLDKDFDVGLGKVTDGARHQILLTFPEIKDFLERERHKELVVVWFEKTVMGNKEDFIVQRATEVTHQMKEVGYKRVVILGMSSSGVHYVADTSLKTKQAE